MHGARTPALGGDRVRIAPWRGDAQVAYVVARSGRPSPTAISGCVDELARRGFRAALTTALAEPDQAPFLANGFAVHERLHLLARPVQPLLDPPAVEVELRRGRRRDRPDVLEVDGAAFPEFWRLDDLALEDALDATPSARFRVATSGEDPAILGYAVTGRASSRGYLQRLAVHPRAQRAGIGTALVADALRWLRRWGADEVLVNTQEDNHAAVALYERLGFRQQAAGLAVLRRDVAAGGGAG
ncbi:MAG: GNAT family N-acetyltransferase [Acidimicrobiales bacterium]|nr:GNAT family N-acetyltransferase [Acidimicrobiales bacterium]